MQTKKEVLTALEESIAKISNLKVEELVNALKLGTLSFEDGRDDFEKLISLCQELRAKPFDGLSIPDAQHLTQGLADLKGSLESIERFSLGGGSTEETRNGALARFRESWRSQNGRLISVISFLRTADNPLPAVQAALTTELEKGRKASEEMTRRLAEMDALIAGAKKASAEIGVAAHATRYAGIAKEHVDVARSWLQGGIGFGAVTMIAAFVLGYLVPVEKGTSLEVWQPIAARIVTLSMLSFATIWSLRNYKTHRHLAIVNGHRHAALSTFEAFANAARDDATKNSVLLEATRAIFALGNTGYLAAGEDDNVPSRVIEVMKLVGDSAKKS